jgi:hypothetical protein
MMLADAADERLIAVNPIREQRRGRRRGPAPEAVWATPTQAIQVALNAARLAGPDAGLLIITAAWTGATHQARAAIAMAPAAAGRPSTGGATATRRGWSPTRSPRLPKPVGWVTAPDKIRSDNHESGRRGSAPPRACGRDRSTRRGRSPALSLGVLNPWGLTTISTT